MFYRKILKEPFEKLFNKAVEEVKKAKHVDKLEELESVRNIMERLLDDLLEQKYDELVKKGDYSEKALYRRKQKSRKVVFSLLNEKMEEMKSSLKNVKD